MLESAHAALNELALSLDLGDCDWACDGLFAFELADNLPEEAKNELLVAYLGFPFFDVLSYPVAR